jgi:N-acetylglucosaminyldiphosphoundecaprenol N-acetyl-beta-D-mannosaminyltransferase
VSARQEFHVLGVRVHVVQIPDVIQQIEDWITARVNGRFIAVTGMHGVSESLDDPKLRDILNAADLVVPDGMSLVWIGRLRGCDLKRRVYGPELMESFCAATGPRYRHFFYGGGPGVAQRIASVEQTRHEIQIAGTYTPPFRPLTPDEELEVAHLVERSRADILWIGLSTPKQERWMYEHRDLLNVPVMAGVGAAFDLNSGNVVQAPRWMRDNGLEWLFRLLAEPRRLWRRYLIKGSKFMWHVALESASRRKYPRSNTR